MLILIHGRKNGYSVLFPKPTPPEFYSFASDIQSISANNDGAYYGCHFYTLAFAEGGCIFTKYVIGDDVERGQLGEIGISVFIPKDRKLSGAEVKTLLDELIEIYSINYINDNKIDEPKSGFNWFLFTALANEYDLKLLRNSYDNDSFLPGSQDPAFHYYNNDIELIEHLDKPFQDEYREYKQILLIDNKLQGDANPLNVIKNSGITVNADLKNEPYYLNNYNRSKGVTITANGEPRSDKRGENQIRSKWLVEINYSKDNRCYEPIHAKGTIADLSTEIHNYIELKGNQILLRYETFNNAKEREKPITFKIEDRNGKGIEGADIQIGTQPWETINGSSITINFKGENIVKKVLVSAKKESEKLHSEQVPLIPENTNGPVVLTLCKHQIVIFQGELKDGNYPKYFHDIKISIPLKGIYNQKPECDFVDDEIDKSYKVTATYSGSSSYLQGETEFCPIDVNFVSIELKRSNQAKCKAYALDMDGHGRASAEYSNSETGNDISITSTTKGYVFKGFILDKNRKHNNFEGTLVAQYEKKKTVFAKIIRFLKRPSGIAASVIIVLGMAFIIWALYSPFGENKPPQDTSSAAERITAYLTGDSLMLAKLNTYKAEWEKQKPEIESFGSSVWYNPTTWFVGENEAVSDSSNYQKWNEIMQSIDNAINLRKMLNDKNFSKLKNHSYSYYHESFKTEVERIDTSQYAMVKTELNDVSNLTLTQIANRIKNILQQFEIENSQEKNKDNLSADDLKTDAKNTSINNSKVNPIAENSSSKSKNSNEGSSNGENEKIKQQKQQEKFQKEFWDIVYKDNPEKKDFDEWYKSVRKISAQDEFKVFYNNYLSKTSAYKKFEDFFKQPSRDKKQKVRTLEELIKEIK